jgi:hypothetical protein
MEEDINKVLKEIQDEMSANLKQLQEKEKLFNHKLLTIQNKFIEVTKIKCKEEFKFLSKEGSKVRGDPKNSEDKNENHKNYSELNKCLSRYENGLQKELDLSQKNAELVSINHQRCINQCENGNPSQMKIKNCIRECVIESFNKTEKIHSNLEKKVDETLIRLNKFLI